MNILHEYVRMCGAGSCSRCPFGGKSSCRKYVLTHPDEAERIVCEWAEAHPEQTVQTYKSYFLERFPNAVIDDWKDAPTVCVHDIFGEAHSKDCLNSICADCWNRPYEEGETS